MKKKDIEESLSLKAKKLEELQKHLDYKTTFIKKILDNIYEILIIFKPVLDKMINSEHSEKLKQEGSFQKAAGLFGQIAEGCKELEKLPHFTDDFFRNLSN